MGGAGEGGCNDAICGGPGKISAKRFAGVRKSTYFCTQNRNFLPAMTTRFDTTASSGPIRGTDDLYGILESGYLDYASGVDEFMRTDEKFCKLLCREIVPKWYFGESCLYYDHAPLPWSLISYLWKRFLRKSKLPEAIEPFDRELNAEKHAAPFIAACDTVPKADLAEYLRQSIDETDIKCFWERHFNKISIGRAVSHFGLELGEEYDEKLRHLDDFRKGEDLVFPYLRPKAEGGQEMSEEELVSKLSSVFNDEDTARRFLKAIRGQKDAEITNVVNHYWEMGAIRKETRKTHL